MSKAWSGTTPDTNTALNRLNYSYGAIAPVLASMVVSMGGSLGDAGKATISWFKEVGKDFSSWRNPTYLGIGSTASSAKMAKVLTCAEQLVSECAASKHNYVWGGPASWPAPYGTDCSGAVFSVLIGGGFNANRVGTSGMDAELTRLGFKRYSGSYWPPNQLLAGDILVKAGIHTNMYLGNNRYLDFSAVNSVGLKRTGSGVETNFGRGWSAMYRYGK